MFVLESSDASVASEVDEEEAFQDLDEDLAELLRTTRLRKNQNSKHREEVDLESETSESSHQWSSSTEKEDSEGDESDDLQQDS